MNTILRSALVVAGLALSTQAAAWTVWPDVDFEWYANVGRSVPANEVAPASREGYIWSPGHWETRGDAQSFVAAHWVKDDYAEQLALHNRTVYATGPFILYDIQGNVIPTNAEAYPVESARK